MTQVCSPKMTAESVLSFHTGLQGQTRVTRLGAGGKNIYLEPPNWPRLFKCVQVVCSHVCLCTYMYIQVYSVGGVRRRHRIP